MYTYNVFNRWHEIGFTKKAKTKVYKTDLGHFTRIALYYILYKQTAYYLCLFPSKELGFWIDLNQGTNSIWFLSSRSQYEFAESTQSFPCRLVKDSMPMLACGIIKSKVTQHFHHIMLLFFSGERAVEVLPWTRKESQLEVEMAVQFHALAASLSRSNWEKEILVVLSFHFTLCKTVTYRCSRSLTLSLLRGGVKKRVRCHQLVFIFSLSMEIQ